MSYSVFIQKIVGICAGQKCAFFCRRNWFNRIGFCSAIHSVNSAVDSIATIEGSNTIQILPVIRSKPSEITMHLLGYNSDDLDTVYRSRFMRLCICWSSAFFRVLFSPFSSDVNTHFSRNRFSSRNTNAHTHRSFFIDIFLMLLLSHSIANACWYVIQLSLSHARLLNVYVAKINCDSLSCVCIVSWLNVHVLLPLFCD